MALTITPAYTIPVADDNSRPWLTPSRYAQPLVYDGVLDVENGGLEGATTDDLPEGATNLYYTDARSRTALSGVFPILYNSTTGAIAVNDAGIVHGNLAGLSADDHLQYHNDARALTWLGTRSTTDLPEGSQLYFNDERAQDAVGGILTNTTTINLMYDDALAEITADLADTAITPGTYGSANQTGVFTVDQQGRLTSASNTTIVIAQSRVINLVADLAAKQPLDATLTALAGVTTGADLLPYFTGTDTAVTTTLTSYGRSLIDDADASTARTTLGLGTIATQNANSVTITGGTINGTSIGATTPSTGNFSTLTTTGDACIGNSTANRRLEVYNASAACFTRISSNISYDRGVEWYNVSGASTIWQLYAPAGTDDLRIKSGSFDYVSLRSSGNGVMAVGSGGFHSTNSIRVLQITGAGDTYVSANAPLNSNQVAFEWCKEGGQQWAAYMPNSSTDLRFYDSTADRLNMEFGGAFVMSSSTTVGKQLLQLSQNDADQAFIDYSGTSAANTSNNITTYKTGSSVQGYIKVKINGVERWMAFGTAPTS